MAKQVSFKKEFDKLANGSGVIGDPHGVSGYAYLRVSTDVPNRGGASKRQI
jgi:hypothetical protein